MKTRRAPQPLQLSLSPSEVAARLHRLPGFVYLDSASGTAVQEPHLSIIGACPSQIHQGSLEQDRGLLREALEKQAHPSVDYGFPSGGLFGHVGYEGDFIFGEYDSLLVYHHHQDCWYVTGEPDYLPNLESSANTDDVSEAPLPSLDFMPESDREGFIKRVQQAQDWIAAGDIYQVNLTQKFRANRVPENDPFALYERLRNVSPAPYGAFLDLGEQHVLSSSPECFLKMSGRGIITRPIKGTRPRFADPLLDEQSAYDLITSPKEVAELVMITDLERNDLGRISEYGSVRVEELLALERYAQVFHLVSTVSGELRNEIDHIEALYHCSPGGSITGAPKKRAMEIIEELEPTARGLYTGAIGYLGWNGESQFSIAIRTLVGESDHWHFHVGAGIVADSDPAAEYEETLHKAAGIFKACGNDRES